jgi:hypothetical protein
MPPKKSSGLGAALQPLDVNQETLREARSQKGRLPVRHLRRSWTKKSGTSKPFINRSRGKRKRCFVSPIFRRRLMRPLKKCVISPNMTKTEDLNTELCQDNSYNNDEWYDDFHHDNFAFDDASPLAAELQATTWPPSYKPHQLSMYDGYSDMKQFLMSYEVTISSYGGNTTVMAKSFVRQSKVLHKLGTLLSGQGQSRHGRSLRIC